MKKLLTFVSILFIYSALSFADQGVSDDEIMLGMHTDISGPVSSFGKYSVEGAKMRINEINEAGGINGRVLKLVAEDHQYQVPRAVQAANKLINKDKIFLMVASLGTPMNNAVFQLQEQKNIPNLFPLSSARSMAEPFHKLKFGALSTYYDQIRSGVKWAVEVKNMDKICVIYQDNDFGQETYDGVVDQLEAMNMSLHEKTTNKPTDTDLTAQITKLKNADCDAVAVGTIVKDTILAYTKARQMGWDALFFGQVASFHPVIASQPDGVTDGFYTFAQFDTPSKENCDEWVCNWIDKYEDIYGNSPNIGSAYGYMYADIAAKAIEIAGSELNVGSFTSALESIDNYKMPFGESVLSWGPDKHLGSSDAYLFVVEDGRFVRADSMKYEY
ncbi:ABC transporter substrate-binding protein [Pelagibacteraceae bacterium]|nr:ABC transporter substrate-binding protein [Pelagibacteraceae bacterium]